MARYIDADELTEQLKVLEIFITGMLCGKTQLTEAVAAYKKKALRLIDEQPTADVVERGAFAKRLLLDLKAAVTNKATYPDFNADYAYINLKVFNALVQELIKKYEEGKDEG